MIGRLELLFCLLIMFVFTACSSGDGGSKSESPPGSSSTIPLLAIKYASNSSASGLQTLTSDDPLPILFGTMAVSLYHYRPGAPVTTQLGYQSAIYNDGSTWGTYGPDWSHWDVMPTGGAGDFLLPTGGEVDLKTIPSSNPGQSFYRELSSISNAAEYAKDVGTFNIDIVYIEAIASLVNFNGDVCGTGYLAWHNASYFPDLNFGTNCNGRLVKSAYDGTYLGALQVLFVRKDWFPQPVQLYPILGNDGRVRCFSSDVALTNFQIEILESFMIAKHQGAWDPGLYHTSCTPNPSVSIPSYSVVPQDGDVPVLQLKALSLPENHQITPSGNSIPQPTQVLLVKGAEARIAFDLLPSMVTNFSSLTDPNDTSDILINGTNRGFPWGLSLSFQKTVEAEIQR